jgi:hypothetical protein
MAKDKGGPVRVSDALDQAEEDLRNEAEERKRVEDLRRAKVVAKVNYSSQFINPFDVLQIVPQKVRGWDAGRQLSEKQRALLLKQGINPDSLPYAQAKQVIGEIFNRWGKKQATFKQAAWLKKKGYETNIPMAEASKIMDSWAKNGWRKPEAQPKAEATVPF